MYPHNPPVYNGKTLDDLRQTLDELFARSKFLEYCESEMGIDYDKLPDEVQNALQDYKTDVEYLFSLLKRKQLPGKDSYYEENK